MTDGMGESDILRAALIDESRLGGGAHPGLDLLAGYHDGTLDDEEQGRVRDHLVGCRRCADQLLELAPLMRPDPAPAEGVADLEIESAWRRFQAFAGAAEAPARVAARPRRALALAASLAVAALMLAIWGLRLQEANSVLRLQIAEVSAPIVNMPVFYVGGVTRGAGAEWTQVEVPATVSHYVLIFSMVDLGAAEEYEVRFIDDEGRERQALDGLVMSESGGLRLGLPSGAIPAGDYRIRLRAREGSVWRPAGEYRCRIGYLSEPANATAVATGPGRR